MTIVPSPYPTSALPADLSPYIYGTTRLGDEALAKSERLNIAQEAMESDVWFHVSEQYGNALSVLGEAFRECPQHIPKIIVKIGNNSVDELRDTIRRNIEPLGLDRINVGQLCLGGAIAEEFANGGKVYDGLRSLQEEGLVENYVLEVFPWTSRVPFDALQAGHPDGLVGACIFYLNPLQRFATNALWDLMVLRKIPMIAMRTVAGGDVRQLRDVPGAAWKPYLQERAVEMMPLFERSGIELWSEFCVRFALGIDGVRATVGSTSRSTGLKELLDASKGSVQPLPTDLQREILKLHRRWSEEVDEKAEPWSM